MASPRAIRIISGKWGNQTIYAPMNFRSRPMGERQRQAIFNSLLDDLPGAIVLDAYAGSGAIGIEAISRGAKQSYFVEKNYSVYKQIRNNLQNLKVPEKQYELFRCSTHAFTKTMKNLKFNIIIADPPYGISRNLNCKGKRLGTTANLEVNLEVGLPSDIWSLYKVKYEKSYFCHRGDLPYI
jgi:16S rRNA (guanine(966)-N(2))-methyltransferase RsmD